jgi:pimeloyl-ACP methyl ester carboxylesterase
LARLPTQCGVFEALAFERHSVKLTARVETAVAIVLGGLTHGAPLPANPGDLPKEVFDGFQQQTAHNRAQFFFLTVPSDPFFGYNRPGAKVSQGNIQNWWRQGMMGGVKAHYDGIVAFSQTDFVPDLKKITVPTLVMHGDDDQIVPYADAGPLSAKLVKGAILKTYKGFPHGMHTTNGDTINKDLLEFVKSQTDSTSGARGFGPGDREVLERGSICDGSVNPPLPSLFAGVPSARPGAIRVNVCFNK